MDEFCDPSAPVQGSESLQTSDDPAISDTLDRSVLPFERPIARFSALADMRPVVAVIDPRSLTREGLVGLLQANDRFQIVPLSSAAELFVHFKASDFNLAIILLNLGANSVSDDAIRRQIASLSTAFPNVPLVVVSDREDSEHICAALHEGVRGYIPTTLTSNVLLETLRLVEAGGIFVPAEALTEALSQRQLTPPPNSPGIHGLNLSALTPRELQVLELLRQGKPNKIIAHELSMRESTVKVHVRQIMRKLRATNRTHAAFLAAQCADC